MIEMFNHNKSNFSEQTKFRAISIMDYYLSLSDVILTKEDDLHLTAIVSIFIASKIEDDRPIRLWDVQQTLGHQKFDQKTIEKKEWLILDTIKFQTLFSMPVDFLHCYLYQIFGDPSTAQAK